MLMVLVRFLGAMIVAACMLGAAVSAWAATAALAPYGSCASGGPYQIAVPCPDSALLEIPAAIVALVAGFIVYRLVARRFGPSPYAGAIPLVLCGVAVVDVVQLLRGNTSWFSLIPAGVCAVIGIALLSARRRKRVLAELLVGEVTLTGEPYRWARPGAGSAAPSARDVAASIGAAVLGGAAGVVLTFAWVTTLG